MAYSEQHVEQEIKTYITQQFLLDQPDAELKSDAKLIQQGIVDSLGIFLLIAFLQERFGIEVKPEEVVLENFESINAIRRMVMARQ